MTHVLAIDPGKSTGWAFFKDGKLTQTGLIDFSNFTEGCAFLVGSFNWMPWIPSVDDFVIEIPQIYQQKNWKGDPNDLIGVALIAGAFMYKFFNFKIRQVTPHQWKGNRPKDIDNKATLRLLDSVEMDIFAIEQKYNGAKAHNIIDAIGIGLWYLGRR